MEKDPRRDLIRLHLSDGIGAILLRRLLDHFGNASAAAAADEKALQQVDGIGPALAGAIRAVTDDQVDEELAEAEKRDIRVLAFGDPDYPKGLARIFDYPLVLYVRGRLGEEDAVGFGVVGSRRCTHYGLEQSERFGELLGGAGFTVVSGGAWLSLTQTAA